MPLEGNGRDPYGRSPYGSVGGVLVPQPHGPGSGYGGQPYGHGAYGNVNPPAPVFTISGGYGGCPYGLTSYGCLGQVFGAVTSAVSVTGFIIEVFFSVEMLVDSRFFDPTNYILTDVFGAAVSVPERIEVGVPTQNGATSALIYHTGTTLGGRYDVTVNNVYTGTGAPLMPPDNVASNVLCKGEPPPYTVTPIDGDTLLVDFERDMLPEVVFSPGIEDPTAYSFLSTFPVPVTVQSVTHPVGTDFSQVELEVQGMTATQYTMSISPADAIIYDGAVLPSAATDFIGTEVGTGTSTITNQNLLLRKQAGVSYGWAFEDTSGKVLPGSSFRAEIGIDATTAAFSPAIFDGTVATFTISDGGVQTILSLQRVGGSDFIQVSSGAYVVNVPQNWSTQPITFGLVRNQQANTMTVVVDDCPVISNTIAFFTGIPTISAGVEFVLDPSGSYEVSNFQITDLRYTSSQTVFSAAWNFLHGAESGFVGDGSLTLSTFKTDCGPLVKGWGDGTPASAQDVTVRVNGVEVEVLAVNPYLGLIRTVVPIPLMPLGAMTVEVDYTWFPSPIMEMVGLNSLGLVLNKYDIQTGGSVVFSPGVGLPGGGSKVGQCYPFGVVIGPKKPRKPLHISHRYLGFEQSYTAAINSPTTLLLNRSNHEVALPPSEIVPEGETVSFDGTLAPFAANPEWTLFGVDETTNDDLVEVIGDPEVFESGRYRVVSQTPGPFGTGTPAIWYREIDVSTPSSIVVASRFHVEADSVTYDGVFSGVGFGAHNDDHLYLVGALLHNDVQHIGMLVAPDRPELIESWQLAAAASISIESANSFTVLTSEIPDFVRRKCAEEGPIGQRFQILSGTQAGVYTIQDIVDEPNGESVVTLTSDATFPADPSVYGNTSFTAYFEVKWDGGVDASQPLTYRLAIRNDRKRTPLGFAQLFLGGSLSGLSLTLDGAPRFATPANSVLTFPVSDRGQVFFGHLDRQAASSSQWSFVTYGIEPDLSTFKFRGIVAEADMTELPEDHLNNVWFATQGFGYSKIDSTGDALLLKSTASNNMPGVEGLDLSFGYGRLEPFLDRTQTLDLDATFRVESGTRGSGDAQIVVRDGEREVRLSTLLYEETATERVLVADLPSVSLSGLLLPEQQVTDDVVPQGWTKNGSLTVERVQNQVIQFQQEVGETLSYTASFSDYFADPLPSGGRILEARLRVDSLTTTAATGETGLLWGTDAGDPGSARGVGLKLRMPVGIIPAQVVLFDVDSGAEVSAFNFEFVDGVEHTYRVLIDPDTDSVTMVIDDQVQSVLAYTANFTITPTDDQVLLGFTGSTTTASLELGSFSVSVLPPSNVLRTLGVWRGGDFEDINNWELPRTDALMLPNSNLAASVEPMDWTADVQVRVHRDPTWGVTILRPDLPPPPFFTGNFATQITEPSAGWINVEYRDLPRLGDALLQGTLLSQNVSESSPPYIGFVSFGALDPASVTQQRWDDVRYRIYQYPDESLIAPHHMVLNQWNVVNSGELTQDTTFETLAVTSLNNTTLSLKAGGITADRVFSLTFTNFDGDTTTLFPDSFTLDFDSQTVTLNDGTAFWEPLNLLTTLPVLEVDPDDPDKLLGALGGDPEQGGLEVFDLDDSTVKIPVTVTFAPGKPVTCTYLETQPLLSGVTILNEGTPPVPKSRICETIAEALFGTVVEDPTDISGNPDTIDNSPYRTVQFANIPSECFYENMKFLEVDNGGLTGQLSSFCDDQGKLAGLQELSLSGLAFTETGGLFISDGTPGSPGAAGGGSGLSLAGSFLMASGGTAPLGGNLCEALLYPPFSSSSTTSPPVPGVPGTVGWGVFGVMYDTGTMVSTTLYFTTGVGFP